MKIEVSRNFDRTYRKLSNDLQREVDETTTLFVEYYASRQFPKSLRVHKCSRFLSLSVSMNYRVFVLPIKDGIKFIFLGDHNDAVQFLKNI